MRHLPLLFATVCLLLAVAVGGLWYRSLRTGDHAAVARPGCGFASAGSNSGWIALNVTREWTRPPLAQHQSGTWDGRSAVGPNLFPMFIETGPGRKIWALGVHVYHGPVEVFVDQAEANALVSPTPRPAAIPMTTIVIPHWLLMLLLALPMTGLSLLRLRRGLVRRHRRRRGLCLGCGYDLRASPGRCPECGTPPPPADSTNRPAELTQVR